MLLAGGLAAALGGCGGTVISHSDMESKLSSYLQLEFGRRVAVSCPTGESSEKGNTFNCTAAATRGRKVKVRVRLEDDHGGFRVVSITTKP